MLLNQTVDVTSMEASSGIYTTSSGEKITADCHFVCVGKPIGSGWLSDSVVKEALDAKGRLKVDKHLRVRGSQIIFAAGDITDIPVSLATLLSLVPFLFLVTEVVETNRYDLFEVTN